MTAEDVRKALRHKFSDHRRYAFVEEVGLTTGFSHRRLDMMVMDCYSSNGFRIDGIEVKVSTADLRRELEDPEKHVAFFDLIDYYTLAAPAGVVEPVIELIPKKWGILIVNENGTTRYKRRPLALEDRKADKAVPRGFFAAVTRAILQRQPAEQEIRDAYERGKAETEERIKSQRGYQRDYVARSAAKLEEYERLMERFRIYGEDIGAVMDEFEQFRKLNIEWVCQNIETTEKKLATLKEMLRGKDPEKS